MRLIDADTLKEQLLRNAHKSGNSFVISTVTGFCKMLDAAPSLALVEARGKWEVGGVHTNGVVGNWKYSVCGKRSLEDSDFCPNCGADMRDFPDNADRCVCCGGVIPEGRQVCPACEGGTNART